MQKNFVKFISFIKIIDLSLLKLIDYYDENGGIPFNNEGQIFISLSAKNKNLLLAFMIETLLNEYEYKKINIIVNTCKPVLNWRQSEANIGALKSYKYVLCDNSIYLDLIQFNKWIDSVYKKLSKIEIDSLKLSGYLKDSQIKNFKFYQNKMHFIEFENIDIFDCFTCCSTLLSELYSIHFDDIQYNILQDGNFLYPHSILDRDSIFESIRLKLIEHNII